MYVPVASEAFLMDGTVCLAGIASVGLPGLGDGGTGIARRSTASLYKERRPAIASKTAVMCVQIPFVEEIATQRRARRRA